jgi:hypothetical protein
MEEKTKPANPRHPANVGNRPSINAAMLRASFFMLNGFLWQLARMPLSSMLNCHHSLK